MSEFTDSGKDEAATTTEDAPKEHTEKPGENLGKDAPTVESLQHQSCPNCHTGVMYVIDYDPEALFEAGQSLGEPHQLKSGGSYTVTCWSCTFSESRALNQEKPAGS